MAKTVVESSPPLNKTTAGGLVDTAELMVGGPVDVLGRGLAILVAPPGAWCSVRGAMHRPMRRLIKQVKNARYAIKQFCAQPRPPQGMRTGRRAQACGVSQWPLRCERNSAAITCIFGQAAMRPARARIKPGCQSPCAPTDQSRPAARPPRAGNPREPVGDWPSGHQSGGGGLRAHVARHPKTWVTR